MRTASESHGVPHAKPIATQKQIQKHKQNVPSSLRSDGAAAPSQDEGAGRRHAQAAIVAAYAQAATEAGVPIVGRARAMIAGQAGLLLDDGWPLEAVLRAVDRFARRRRYAGHLAQWVRENAADERESEHRARMTDDKRTAESSMRSLFQMIRERSE